MRALNDPTARLARAIARSVSPHEIRFDTLHSCAWASATYAGTRHELAFSIIGEDAEEVASGFLDGLSEREFALSGHILIDIALVNVDHAEGSVRIAIEALTIEDD